MKTEYSSLPFDVRKKLKFENIQNGNYNLYHRYHSQEMKYTFTKNDDIPEEFIDQRINESRRFYKVFENYSPIDYKICTCIKDCEIAKRKRIRERMQNYVQYAFDSNKKILFITLTFTNESLQNTTFDTRRRYVARWLKDNCIKYIANLDFGEQNGREHYHCFVVVDGKLDYTSWSYGACNGENFRVTKKSTESDFKKNTCKLSRYLTKLTSHALKDSTTNNRLIYSRN